MKFYIERTSDYGAKPTADAVYVETDGDFGYKMYTIEIRTLEELMKLIEKEGQIVISPNSKGLPTIEIYDDWRE
jgi:hypothetical protein